MKRRREEKVYYSNCGDIFVRQTAKGCELAYEKMGYDQLRLKNHHEAHNFFQHAEHYKKIQNRELQD